MRRIAWLGSIALGVLSGCSGSKASAENAPDAADADVGIDAPADAEAGIDADGATYAAPDAPDAPDAPIDPAAGAVWSWANQGLHGGWIEEFVRGAEAFARVRADPWRDATEWYFLREGMPIESPPFGPGDDFGSASSDRLATYLFVTTTSGRALAWSAGAGWRELDLGDPLFEVLTDGGVIFARGKGALHVSHDGGASWTTRPPIAERLRSVGPDGELLLTSTQRSEDGGATWTPIAFPLGAYFASPPLFDLEDPRLVYARGDDKSDDRLLRSQDGGRTFEVLRVPFSILSTGLATGLDLFGHGVLYAVGDRGLERSTDHGLSWTEHAYPVGGSPSALSAGRDRVALGDRRQGIDWSEDGSSWTAAPLMLAPVRRIAIDRHYPAAVTITAAGRLHHTTTRGELWESGWADHRYADDVAIAPTNPLHLFTDQDFSSDGGVTWQPSSYRGGGPIAADPIDSSGLWGVSYALDVDHPYLGFGGASGPRGPVLLSCGKTARDLAVGGPAGETIVLSLDDALASSHDGGRTFACAPVPGGAYGVAVDPTNGAYAFAATPYALLASTDAGATWHPLGGAIEDATLAAVAIDPTTPTRIFAGGATGVFRSLDRGATWAWLDSGVGTDHWNAVTSLAIGADHTVFVGTFARGVRRLAVPWK